MKIFINNIPEFEEDIRKVTMRVVKGENLTGELSITFIDDAEMRKMNKKYANKDKTTDVLSFSFGIPEILGDIYISLPQAQRQKVGSLLSELKLLTVHGILHLAGYNDATEKQKKEMREKEKEYLARKRKAASNNSTSS
jgi:probable rRNA maturation factor